MAFLTNSIELHFKGSAVALAKAMGVQKHSLHGWHRGNHFPTFRQLVSIANIHGCSLMDVCSGDAMTINRIPDSRIPTAIPSRRASPRDIDWPEVQMKLEAVVTAPTAPCLYEVARMLNLAARTLRTKFPDLSKRISSRNKEFKTADLHYRLEEHRLWIRSSADDMVAEGLRPTPKAVIARLDVPYQFFWHDIKMVRQICAAVAQDQPS